MNNFSGDLSASDVDHLAGELSQCFVLFLLIQRTAQCDGVRVVGAADRSRTGIKCCLLCVSGCSLAVRVWGHPLTSQRVGSDCEVVASHGGRFLLRCCVLKEFESLKVKVSIFHKAVELK